MGGGIMAIGPGFFIFFQEPEEFAAFPGYLFFFLGGDDEAGAY